MLMLFKAGFTQNKLNYSNLPLITPLQILRIRRRLEKTLRPLVCLGFCFPPNALYKVCTWVDNREFLFPQHLR